MQNNDKRKFIILSRFYNLYYSCACLDLWNCESREKEIFECAEGYGSQKLLTSSSFLNDAHLNVYLRSFQMVWLPIVIFIPALAFNQGAYSRERHSSLPFKLLKLQLASYKFNDSELYETWIAKKKWIFVLICIFFCIHFLTVSGINIHMITPITCVCTIFYTLVGGMKAVVYTDVVQSVIMFGAMFLVVIKGTLDIGGLDVVIDRNIESGRIEAPE